MGILPAAILAALALSCSHGRSQSQPAGRPLTPAEVGSWNVTVAERPGADHPALGGDARAVRDALAGAMAQRGFKLVGHPPYHHDLEVAVYLETAAGAHQVFAAAHLTTDGFFVADARERVAVEALRDPDQLRALAAALATTLARSEGLASFVRNSGVPAQTPLTN